MPQEILDKPSALTSAEWRTVVQHPRIGQVILEQAAALKDAVPIILHHHERYAGHGYPYGLRANEIPLGARIVAIADAYDAMVHDRPYKRAMSHDQAIAELRRHAGTQFDPELVELFCDLYADRAPEPDVAVTALNAASAAHHGGPGALVVPDPVVAARSARRRKRTDLRPADAPHEAGEGAGAAEGVATKAEAGPADAHLPASASKTMAADGALGLVPSTVQAMPAPRSGRTSRGRTVVG